MSRRCHHGSPRHVPLGRVPRRPATALPERPAPPTSLAAPRASSATAAVVARPAEPVEEIAVVVRLATVEQAEPIEETATLGASEVSEVVEVIEAVAPPMIVEQSAPSAKALVEQPFVSRPPQPRPFPPRTGSPRPAPRPDAAPEQLQAHHEGEDGAIERTATAPQLRRFIKSRAYVPMHELRRRFVINGGDDDVTPVDIERKRIFVGLPEREGRLLGELLRAGDIGYELSLDPISPIVVGVYPMRPVTRS